MSGVNDQIKQQALTRIAASRLHVVESVATVRNGVQGCVRSFPVSGAALKTIGAALGGLVVSGVIAGKIARTRKTKPAAPAASPALSGRSVALQALSAIAIPLAQRWLAAQGQGMAAAAPAPAPKAAGASSRSLFPDFNAIFYRWLGLQK